MGAGYVGILAAELHFPAAHSLKEKRMHVRSARQQLANRFGASVAEVAHHDTWQRARLLVSCSAREYAEAERLLAGAERFLWAQPYEVGRCDRSILSLEDLS